MGVSVGMKKSNFGKFDKPSDAILFFCPEATLTPHFTALCILARTLQERGYQVYMARCRGQLNRCPVIDSVSAAYNLTPAQQHAQFCNACIHNFEAITQHYGLPVLDFGEYLDDKDFSKVENSFAEFSGDPLEFVFDGIRFGLLGAADFALVNKHSNMDNLSSDQLNAWGIHTANAMLAYLGIDKICERHPIKRICCYNPYAIALGANAAAQKHEIPFLNFTQAAHQDIDRQRFVIVPRMFCTDVWYDWITDWYRWRDLALPQNLVKEISDDSIMRQIGGGAQHYSPAKTKNCETLLSDLGFTKEKKLIVAYTSSLDEYKCGSYRMRGFNIPERFQGVPFESHLEWLEALVSYVEASSDLQLVVRIHPREAANQRESKVSEHLHLLQERFGCSWQNCRFIWPQDKVSSYDLAELASLVLTSWSTIGLEMARIGIPVITAYRHYNCPDDEFLWWGGETEEEYFATIRTYLEKDNTLENVIRAYRCYNYITLSNALLLDDVIPNKNFTQVAPFSVPREGPAIESVFVEGTSICSIQRQRLLAKQEVQDYKSEREAVKQALKRIIHLYCVGEDVSGDLSIELCDDIDISDTQVIKTSSPLLSWFGDEVSYYHQGQCRKKYSPFVARLGRILKAAQEDEKLDKPVSSFDYHSGAEALS